MVIEAIVGVLFVACGVVLVASPGLFLRMLHYVRRPWLPDPLKTRMPAWLLRVAGVVWIAAGINALTLAFLR